MMKSEELIERFRKEYLTNMEYDELKDLYDYINYKRSSIQKASCVVVIYFSS